MKRSEINDVELGVKLMKSSSGEPSTVGPTLTIRVGIPSGPPASAKELDDIRKATGELMDFITRYLCY